MNMPTCEHLIVNMLEFICQLIWNNKIQKSELETFLDILELLKFLMSTILSVKIKLNQISLMLLFLM